MVPTILGVLSAAWLLNKAALLVDRRETAKAFVLVFAALWICNKLVALDIDLFYAVYRTLH
jgi:hypothetical protein